SGGLPPLIPPILAKPPDVIGNAGVLRHDHAAVADRSEVLCRIETEAANVADAADAISPVTAPRSLSAIFDQAKAMAPGDGSNRVHVRRLPIEMDGDDRLGPPC